MKTRTYYKIDTIIFNTNTYIASRVEERCGPGGGAAGVECDVVVFVAQE